MLCADCKKNQAVIYINKIDEKNTDENKKHEMIGLCMPCARKRGLNPLGVMPNPLNDMSPEDMENTVYCF